jgi:23S rRNA (guanine745-N1)-methyltransferase
LDLGSGPGHYLAALLEPVPRPALALDASKAAARRAAKAHPGITAVVCDAWRRLPIRSASMALALNVFAPRNPDELSRVLRQDGRLLVITPTPEHLRELVGALDLLSVAADKRRRLDDQLDPVLRRTEDDTVTFELSLNRVEAATLVAMGPNAWHTRSARVESILAGIAEPIRATASVRITEWSPRPGRHH